MMDVWDIAFVLFGLSLVPLGIFIGHMLWKYGRRHG